MFGRSARLWQVLAFKRICRQVMVMLMPSSWTLENIASLRETDEVEVKLAAGKDGRGELPKDFWPSYSAFANTSGGYIILGVREIDDRFRIEAGIQSSEKVRRQLFDQLGNLQKVSANVIGKDDVETVQVDGRNVIIVRVPPASRRHKPVFIDGNPLRGTYRRVNDGDRLCDAETVKRMLAEQTEDSRDDRTLKGFGIEDLSADSVEVYRRMLRDRSSSHPFLDLPYKKFLERVRAWRRDRESGIEGLTVAGLLMFGTSEAIRDEFPNFTLDYQERDEGRVSRWVDRLTNDGTWSGNIFDFYRLVLRKLYAGLKVPFKLLEGVRIDETSAHEAIRESLVNCLVHADFTGRASVLVVRRPDMFGFRNPGGMRIPIELAIRGGESDGRNRTLQQMFLLVGAGERAGSGVPRIHKGWREQHWRPPSLYEVQEPSEQTLLTLHMEDLLPAEAIERLHKQFGDDVDQLSPDERVVLSTAALENTISHSRAMTLCDMHSVDLTRLLQRLVHDGYLEKVGQGRGTKYHLPGTPLLDPDDAFSTPNLVESVLPNKPPEVQGEPSELDSKPSESNSEGPKVRDRSGEGRLVAGLDMPVIDDLAALNKELLRDLNATASLASQGRVARERMEAAIIALCTSRYLTLRSLAALLNRSEDYLRQGYMNPMASEGKIQLAFPQKPNSPLQAYTASE